jgi:predicted enzyme related to lactoylglutathione lyase
MDLALVGTIFDCHDPVRLAQFWSAALGYQIVAESAGFVAIAPTKDKYPGLAFISTEGEKTGKNRLHLDLKPADQDAEVARLLDLGARLADIGQGPVSWVVMTDPEGNEFCVLSSAGEGPLTH